MVSPGSLKQRGGDSSDKGDAEELHTKLAPNSDSVPTVWPSWIRSHGQSASVPLQHSVHPRLHLWRNKSLLCPCKTVSKKSKYCQTL